MVAAAGVMMTGAADVEAAAAMEVAASADALQAAGQQETLLPADWASSLLTYFLSLSCQLAKQSESVVPAGFDCVSVLANHPRLGPLRSGVCWDAQAGAYVAAPLLRAVEPPVAGAEFVSCCKPSSCRLLHSGHCLRWLYRSLAVFKVVCLFLGSR